MPDVERPQGGQEALPEPPPTHHSNAVAAWVCVATIIVGAAVAALGVATLSVWLAWAGLAIVVIGLIVGKIMQLLGFGSAPIGTTRADQRLP